MTGNTEHEAIFNDSYERVLSYRASERIRLAFFDEFYKRFVEASEEVRQKFQHTDMAVQRLMLKKSLVYLLNYYATENVNEFLKRTAERHGRQDLDIRPELYDLWLDKLIETLAECDPKFSTRVEEAWRTVLTPGISYMRSMY